MYRTPHLIGCGREAGEQHLGDSLVSGSHRGACHSELCEKRTREVAGTQDELEVSSRV